jgi:predicted Rossmann-fold nucleotide-binding protein
VFFNQDGFYDDLLRLFERMLAERFFKPSNMDLFRVAASVPDIFVQIEHGRAAKAEAKWFQTT